MRYIPDIFFYLLPVVTEEKKHIRLCGNYILKKSTCELNYLLALQEKRISHVETPIKIYRGNHCFYCVTHYYRDYVPIHFSLLSDSEFITVMKNMNKTLREMHQNDLYTIDLGNYHNILVNDDLDYQLIDFDCGMVNGIFVQKKDIHFEHILSNGWHDIYQKYGRKLSNVEKICLLNKLQLLDLLQSHFCFYQQEDFNQIIQPEILKILSGTRQIDYDDYLDDIYDDYGRYFVSRSQKVKTISLFK